jgi:hypothetical protein
VLLAVSVLAAPVARAAQPALRGVIEGYYGRPWTGAARRDVIRFLARRGLRTFVYAPKNDDFHRRRWRDPYPADALADLGRTTRSARRLGVRFIYALSPGGDVCYSCADDLAALAAKLAQVAVVGVRDFALLVDDTPERLADRRDVAAYGGGDESALGRAQADFTDRVAARLAADGIGALAFFVPTIYAGTACRPYHAELRARLAPTLPVAWTGPGVLSARITTADVDAFAGCVGHPVVLWDNYPVNDAVMANSLHLGPLTGRDAGVPAALAGYLLNPMPQAYASLVALGTAAAYLRDPPAYDPERAWRRALRAVGRETALGVLAAQTRSSALDLSDARPLATLLDRIAATYDGPAWRDAVDALETEERRQAAAARRLPRELAGTALWDEIAPWVSELDAHAARGLEAATLLRAMKPDIGDLRIEPRGDAFQVEGRARAPDVATAVTIGEGFVVEAERVTARVTRPDLGGYLACLGDFLGAAIRLCPEFGLNVHGKSLFFIIRSGSDIEIVSDRNVHDRLVVFAAARYAEWRARRAAGADVLRIEIGDRVVMPVADGRFDVHLLGAGGSDRMLRVRTAAGETTSVAIGAP